MKLSSHARLGFAVAIGALTAPGLAHADPVTLAVGIIGYLGVTGTAATIGTFVLTAAIGIGETFALSKNQLRVQQEPWRGD